MALSGCAAKAVGCALTLHNLVHEDAPLGSHGHQCAIMMNGARSDRRTKDTIS
jgi:hypothetical protein